MKGCDPILPFQPLIGLTYNHRFDSSPVVYEPLPLYLVLLFK